MQLGRLAEMEAVDGECNRQGKQAWTPEQGSEKEPPTIVKPAALSHEHSFWDWRGYAASRVDEV